MSLFTGISAIAVPIFLLFFLLLPLLLNAALAKSRGKSVPLMLLLTIVFSWIVTLILALLPKTTKVDPRPYIIIGIAPFIVGVVFMVAGLISYQILLKPKYKTEFAQVKNLKHSGFTQEEKPINEPLSKVSNEAAIGPMINIKEFIVNIKNGDNDGGRHHAKAEMTVELASEEAAKKFSTNLAQANETILLIISNKSFTELQSVSGKRDLKKELLLKLNSLFEEGIVKGIYFTKFVVQ